MRSQPSAVVSGTNPAAGQDYVYTLTSAKRLVGFYGVLSASATVATRLAQLTFLDPSGQHLFLSPQMPGLTASQFAAFQWHQEWPLISGAVSGSAAIMPLPNIYLPAGSKIQTATTGIQAGDTWSFLRLTFE